MAAASPTSRTTTRAPRRRPRPAKGRTPTASIALSAAAAALGAGRCSFRWSVSRAFAELARDPPEQLDALNEIGGARRRDADPNEGPRRLGREPGAARGNLNPASRGGARELE